MSADLDVLVAAACKPDRPQQAEAAVKKLVIVFSKVTPGKENGSGVKQLKAAALQCVKTAQAKLAEGSGGSLAQYVSLGQASLAALEAHSPGGAGAQLLPLRYNFVKQLVAARSYDAAWQEAYTLHSKLSGSAEPLPRTAEAANIAVGAVLMLLLCCMEGKELAGTHLLTSLEAAESLESWLEVLPHHEAEKHRDAVFKYLYKVATQLLERRECDPMAAVVAAMAAVAASQQHLQRVLQATLKFAAHMPDVAAAGVAAAAVAALLGGVGAQLPDALAQDAVSILCAACQRAQEPAAASYLWGVLAQCASTSSAVLQQAALLLPFLVAQQGWGGMQPGDWVQPVTLATATATASLAALQRHLKRARLPAVEVQQHASVLAAAFQPANLLRKAMTAQLAPEPGGVCVLLRSSEAVTAAARQLELLGPLVATAHAASTAAEGAALAAQLASMSRQGHAAVVGLATAAKLRAACITHLGASVTSADAVTATLGWDFRSYCSSGGPLPEAGCLSGQELSWLAAALYNVGVDLHGEGHFEAASPPLLAAVSASVCCMAETILDGGSEEVVSQRGQDLLKRCSALSDAQRRAGSVAAAAGTLGHAVAALVQCGLGAPAWQGLLSSFAKQALDMRLSEREEADAADGAPAAPMPKSKGARSARAVPARGKAAAPAHGIDSSSSRSSRSSGAAAVQLSCFHILCSHSDHIPAAARVSVAEQELYAWAALAGGGSNSVPGARCTQLCRCLLAEGFPAEQCPAEHARILLAMYQSGLAAGELAGTQLLTQAVAVLGGMNQQDDARVAALAGRACGLLSLAAAQGLVEHSMLDQRQQRQQSHAAASTSNPGNMGSADRDSLPNSCSLDAEAWRSVAAQAEAAVQHLECAARCSAHGAPETEDWEALAHLAAELGYMAALQGQEQVEARCQQLCVAALSSVQASPSSRLMQWAAITPASGWLSSCLFPALRPALAQCLPGLEVSFQAWPGTMAALHSSAGAEQLDLDTLHGRLRELAAGPKNPSISLQRAYLHRLLAEQEASSGNVVAALYHATEMHRLVFSAAPTAHMQPSAAWAAQDAAGRAAGSSAMGWWQLGAEQMCSLMQLGQLFELSGMADEALHAFKEGLRMAVSTRSQALAAAFRIQLADVYSKQGSIATQHALQPVSDLLAAASAGHAMRNYLQAQLAVVEARLALASCDYDAAWQHSQAAINLCAQAGAAGMADSCFDGQLTAIHAWAVLTSAQCRAGQGNATVASQLALEAAGMLDAGAAPCSCRAAIQPRAAALLFLALQDSRSVDSAQQEVICVWGLQLDAPGDASAPEARTGSTRPAAKKAAGRGARGKAAAAREPAEKPTAAGCSKAQLLWQAYWLTREVPHINRVAAAHLASECGSSGCAQLAVLLLHASLGATMRQQYRLVLHTKLQQLQHCAWKAPAADAHEQQCSILQAALYHLEEPLDMQLVRQLAGLEAGPGAVPPPPPKGRKRAAALLQPQDALARLEQQAEAALQRWVGALPDNTVVCSVSSQPLGRTLMPASKDERLVVSRIAAGAPPVILQLPAVGARGLKQHPIKALSLDPEISTGAGRSWGVHSLVEDMLCVLEESSRSMQDMATDTREQQREWWRARLALNDRLGALLQTMDTAWLSCWRCLLLGEAPGQEEHAATAGRIVQQLQAHVAQCEGAALSEQQLALLQAVLASLLQGSSELDSGAVGNACGQLCGCLGLSLTPEQTKVALESASDSAQSSRSSSSSGRELGAEPRSGRQGGRRAVGAAAPGDGEPQPEACTSSDAISPKAAPARGRRAGAAKTVSFQVEPPPVPEHPEDPEPGGHQKQQQPARSRRASTHASKAAASAAVEPGPEPAEGLPCSPPPAVAVGPAEQSGDLCRDFDAMSLQQAVAKPRAMTTVRASKHRSRLRMMQASTPGPAASGSRAPGEHATTAPKAAATAPRLRGSSAAVAAGVASGSDTAASGAGDAGVELQRGPVLLVLDGVLQALPWESVPGLRNQRMYRIPSLACAAASAQRSLRDVDLSSTFYSINPSGDLASTQSAFQDWFSQLQWEGKAGEPPSASELAAALQSHQLFVYFGHGGGEQYIPVGKLRSLDSCSAALLMGCSSGRLRLQQHYEPTGAVLAYLLAGCPTAVANLWDVTDKDIDRFSQALLSAWLDKGEGAGGGLPTPTKVDVSSTVAGSRAACKLPHLIGSAPVCYGLPTSVL